MKVYKAINAVQAELAKDGITKDRKNVQQGYNFRGIDDVYNALAPLLAKHGLCILPRCTYREAVERATAKGGVMFSVAICAEFDFVCAEDGSKHTVVTYGEAMDSGDKATNKAMSAAYKYAAFQAFAIPTEGDNDADAHTPPPVQPGRPMDGVWESLNPETQGMLQQSSATLREYIEGDDMTGAVEYLERLALGSDEKAGLWTLLKSNERSAIKKAIDQRKHA
jgi:hypothetical protein